MAKSAARTLVLCALAGLSIGTAGCMSGPHTVSKADVENQIGQKMSDRNGHRPESATCPDDLKAAVGATLDCQMKMDGQTYEVDVTLTSIEGDTAKFDMVKVYDKNQIANQIGEQLGEQLGHKPQSVTCPDKLRVVNGATLRCESTDAGKMTGVIVNVTGEGSDARIRFEYEQPNTKP